MGKWLCKELTVSDEKKKELSWTCLSKHISITLRESLKKRIYSKGAGKQKLAALRK